jgi:hypothetical protein
VTQRSDIMDSMAIGLSSLCLVHCLLFPLAIAVLPMLASVLSLPEVLHKILALTAIPISLFAIGPGWRVHRQARVMLFAIGGLICLAASAFLLPLAPVETELTVAGAAMLATAHILNWRYRRRKRFACQTSSAML